MGLAYTSIRVKDMGKSVRFYTRGMGLKVVGKRSPIPGEEIVSLEDKSTKQRINLMWYSRGCRMYAPWKQDGVELDHLMFVVKDAKRQYKALVSAGAPVAMELHDFEREGTKISMGFVKDPNGIWVGLRSESKSRG